jgi:DDE superfamily endonuclease
LATYPDRDFLDAVDAAVPAGLEAHAVLDHASIHKAPAVKAWPLERPRYQLRFTPTAGSWLDQVERFFALLTAWRLKRGVHRSVEELEGMRGRVHGFYTGEGRRGI